MRVSWTPPDPRIQPFHAECSVGQLAELCGAVVPDEFKDRRVDVQVVPTFPVTFTGTRAEFEDLIERLV